MSCYLCTEGLPHRLKPSPWLHTDDVTLPTYPVDWWHHTVYIPRSYPIDWWRHIVYTLRDYPVDWWRHTAYILRDYPCSLLTSHCLHTVGLLHRLVTSQCLADRRCFIAWCELHLCVCLLHVFNWKLILSKYAHIILDPLLWYDIN